MCSLSTCAQTAFLMLFCEVVSFVVEVYCQIAKILENKYFSWVPIASVACFYEQEINGPKLGLDIKVL